MSILLTDLTKLFGDRLVVNRVNLEIQTGELFVLLGGSGSGKSTILRMIAGLTTPDSGKIELDGKDMTDLPPQARGTGFVFQNYSIFRHMTVSENIEFGLRIRKVSAAERRHRREELLELVGLAGLGTRYSDQLSGGQRQRVALARALAYHPNVLLLDEPFGALDVKIRAQLRESLREIQDKLKLTTILVTHDQEEAFELADRIGVIETGRLIEVGNPEVLYHRPRTEAVAKFIGGGNVLVGRVINGKIRLGSIDLPFPEGSPTHEEGSPVRILFRPETVAISDAQPPAAAGFELLVQGRVTERIFAGSQQRTRVELGGLQGIRSIMPMQVYGRAYTVIESVQSNTPNSPQYQPGQNVWLGLTGYHVLEPTGIKALICYDPNQKQTAALDFGCKLAEATLGPTTILNVIDKNASLDEAQEAVESMRPKQYSNLSNLATKIRQGEVAAEILAEAQEGHYEVVILHHEQKKTGYATAGSGRITRPVLASGVLPVLLVNETRSGIGRILICTAAGEPGKVDVLFGGRVARRTGAHATILHILNPTATPRDIQRIELHLQSAQRSLDALGVPCSSLLKPGAQVVRSILSESEAGDYDLIVIGAPLKPQTHQIFWTDFTSTIINGTTRPVLVVPMLSQF